MKYVGSLTKHKLFFILMVASSMCVTILFLDRTNFETLNKITLNKPSYYVFGVDWHPDGRRLAAASDAGSIDIWDVTDQRLLNSIQDDSESIGSVAWKSDGNQIAAVGASNVFVWDISTQAEVFSAETQPRSSSTIWWSDDDRKLVTVGSLLPAQMAIWDLISGNLISTFSAGIDSVDINNDVIDIAVSKPNGDIEIRSIQNPGEIRTFLPGDDPSPDLYLASWSPNSQWIASTSIDNSIFIWGATDSTKVATFTGHTQPISGLAWSTDNNQLVTTSHDGTIRVWDVQEKKQLSVLTLPIKQYALGWQNGRSGIIWNSTSDKIAIVGGELDSQGNASSLDKVFILSLNASGIVTNTLQHEREVTTMDWSPDGSQLAVCGGFGIVIWDLATG